MVTAKASSSSSEKRGYSYRYHIGGISVEFPYKPYGSQLAYMGRVISTLDRALKEGHCHALLESPTGTGKSLSLLCSALAWQRHYKPNNNLPPHPDAISDPFSHAGGFLPDIHPSGNAASENPEPTSAGNTALKGLKKNGAPTILYATRTHSQISQVIREYRKTSYRVPMSLLASRKHYCTNPYVRGKPNIDEECKLLRKDARCSEFKNVHKVKSHPSIQKGGCNEAFDIEDLVKVGEAAKGCAYYAAISLEDDAQLVFCPYSYIINPVIRGAMDVDIRGAIIIFDEAHNIEDTARDAGSVDIEEDDLDELQKELMSLCMVDAATYQPLYEMTQGLVSWIEEKKQTVEKPEFKRGFQYYCSCWTGDKALKELQAANISQQCFPILYECAKKAIKAAIDKESDVAHVSGKTVIILEGLFSSLTYFFSRNGSHIFDYQLALRKYFKKSAGNDSGEWINTMSLWCLNPAVVFQDVAEFSLSVILTSGTLSPMNSFSSELGVTFGTCLEAPHVIDVEAQVFAAVISTGPGNYPLNASYKSADRYDFQDALGKTLEEICSIVPGGALIFFPSYKLMDKLCDRWRETGQWSRLNATKPVFVEPRGGNQDDLEPVLKGYYDTIHKTRKPTMGRKRCIKNMKLYEQNEKKSSELPMKGAAFLAVCRGKVSEGIDFSDDNARVVIVVGIPFPNVNDVQVSYKKKYNDTYKYLRNLLSGSEWYCHQAFRALNQAAGRCIRHRHDYGAIILIDERYREERNQAYISKWLRKSIRQYDDFKMSMDGLESFFSDVKERIGNNAETVPESFEFNGATPLADQSNEIVRKKNDKNQQRLQVSSLSMKDYTFHQMTSEVLPSTPICGKKTNGSLDFIDLECSPLAYTRCSKASPVPSSCEDPDVILVGETPNVFSTTRDGSPVAFEYAANLNLPKDHITFGTHELLNPVPPNSSKTISKTQGTFDTPEKIDSANTSSPIQELDMSVNSHARKRRHVMGSPLVNLSREQSNPHDIHTDECTSLASSIISRLEFDTEKNNTEHTYVRSNGSAPSTSDCGTLHECSGIIMDKRLQISCSLCQSPLGLPDNNLYVACSLTSSRKVHLASLLKERLTPPAMKRPASIPVLITEVTSVDQRVFGRTLQGATGQGIWCEEDGCVYNKIFCPYCCKPSNILGVQIMATDSSNVCFLNKAIFYVEHLEIKDNDASDDKDLQPVQGSTINKAAALDLFDKFSYSPKVQNSGGWRTTRTKLRLPKRS